MTHSPDSPDTGRTILKPRYVLPHAILVILMLLPAVSQAAPNAPAGKARVAEVAPPPHVIILVPRIVTPEARLPIRLKKLDVKAEVLGRSAHTRVEMTFYNPNERVLEGELQFPLLDGQTVSGFALDIGGELRAAVPVEKDKGQEVFEDVIRARVDPALLEKTEGNNYKVRVYPLPARGERRIAVEYDEVLPESRSFYLAYRLPLQFAETVEQLDVAVHNVATPSRHASAAVAATLGAERLKVEYGFDKPGRGEGSTVSLVRRNYSGRGVLNVEYYRDPMSLAATGEHDGRTYFYAERSVNFGKPQPRPAPRRMPCASARRRAARRTRLSGSLARAAPKGPETESFSSSAGSAVRRSPMAGNTARLPSR